MFGKQKQEHKKTLRSQAHQFIRENSFRDLENGETVNTATPAQVVSYLNCLPDNGKELKIISPAMFGSVVADGELLVQAAQGLVLESGVKY